MTGEEPEENVSDDPAVLLPETSVLPLEECLDKLVDVGLVEKRKRAERDSEGLYTYYRATVLGEVILEHGVEELLRRERDFTEAYDSAATE